MREAADHPCAARWIRLRIGMVVFLLGLGLLSVAARAFQLQVLRSDREAVDHYLAELKLRPRRGVIADRNGVLLAVSADAQSAYVDPEILFGGGLKKEQLEADPRLAAQKRHEGEARLRRTARILGQDPTLLLHKASHGGRFLWLARRILPDKEAALREYLAREKITAIGLVPEPRRYYPKAELAGPLLGLVDEDGAGIEGVELGQEEALQGVPAELRSLRDGKGRIVLSEPPADGKEREGARVELTIDQGIQATAERALARAVLGSHALSGMAVALSPTTGEVLAMASWPATNANAPRTPEELRNRVVTDAFEPGSTIKSFSISTALDAGVLQPTDAIDCGNGNYAIGGHVIHDHGGGLGWAGPSRIIAQSSNIGAAKIASRLGKDRLRAGLAAFGFGEKTGVGLPGEVRGQLLLARSDVGLATQAFGQGPITATALQITNAFGAIANGGVLLRPWLLKRVVDPVSGDAMDEGKPLALRRAISPGTAATMTRWLLGVVEDPKGTGKKAALDGWRAAGKTGTAQKVDRISGGYSDKRFSSFVGFAPVEAPRIVVGVFIDEPRGEVFGGEVAAPAFKEIAEYALRVLDVRPAPALAARPAPAAEPEPRHAEEEEPESAAVELSDGPLADGKVAVPPLDGLTARSAIRTLETLDLAAELKGSGRVVEQSPPPGKAVDRGTRVRMTLAPAG